MTLEPDRDANNNWLEIKWTMQKEAKIGNRCWLNCYIILVLSDLLKDLVSQKNLLDKDIWKEESRGTVPNKKSYCHAT